MKKIIAVLALLVLPLGLLTACSEAETTFDSIMRDLGMTPGVFYNYGADGQVVYEAQCSSMSFTKDTKFDRHNEKGERIEDGSVIAVSCGGSIISTVGFTSVYLSGDLSDMLFADSQKFANLRIQNNDRGIPLLNFAWRDVTNLFAGTAAVASVCDQNNNPILAFAADEVTPYATSVDKSTMFKLVKKVDGVRKKGYVWVSRGSYTVTDTALLNNF